MNNEDEISKETGLCLWLNSFYVQCLSCVKVVIKTTESYGKNEKLHNLYSSPDIIRQIKSRHMPWAGHVARMGEKRKL
jgi:hypothetical protein